MSGHSVKWTVWGWVFALFFLVPDPSPGGEPPRRAISQVPSITEILFSLGQEERVAGVSRFCRFPPEAQAKPKVGGLHDADLERILALNPDWIALFKGQSKIGDVLTARGCQVYYCDVETIEQMYVSIQYLGAVFSVPEKAGELIGSMSSGFQDIRHRLADLPRKRVLYVVGREPGSLKQLYGVGQGTFLAEILEMVGATNCVDPKLGRYPVISREAIIVANPEVILDGGATPADRQSGIIPPEWSALASVSAVREKRILMIDDPHLTIPGPGITASIRDLAFKIHGEAARQRFQAVP